VHVVVVRASGRAVSTASRTVGVEGLDDVLPHSDVVVIMAPLTAATRGMFDSRRLRLLPPEAVVVNVSRGALVDTRSLVDVLEEGRIGGAGLDVTDPEPLPGGHPLWSSPRCLVTPHCASTLTSSMHRFSALVEDNVRRFAAGLPLLGRVDPGRGY
jgi:phosphoglycerate dehydrogenase-like enzyme